MEHKITLSDGTIVTLGESPRDDGMMGIYLISYEGPPTAYDKLIESLKNTFHIDDLDRVAETLMKVYGMGLHSGLFSFLSAYYNSEEASLVNDLICAAHKERKN